MLKKSTQECGVEIEKTRQMQEHHSINFYKHHQISGIVIVIVIGIGKGHKIIGSDSCWLGPKAGFSFIG